jgi:mycofactocin precursor
MTTTADEHSARDEATAAATSDGADDEVLADLLVEEISIDGMCGVY